MEDYSLNEVEAAKAELGVSGASVIELHPPKRGRGNPNLPREEKTDRSGGENAVLPDAFANDKDAPRDIKSETYVHRLIITLAAEGFNHTEIGKRLEIAATTVSTVLRQPWARTRLIAMFREAGRDELKALLAPAATDSVLNFIAIANDPREKTSDRIAANKEILDRFLGKSAQPILKLDAPPDKLKDAELIQQIRESRSGAA